MVGQIHDERAFHIFYQFTKGASAAQKGRQDRGQAIMSESCSEAFGLQGPEAYAYISRSGCLDVRSINDVNDFQETLVSKPVLSCIYTDTV